MSSSLYHVFEQLPDPRSRHGRRHPLAAVLTLSTVAILSGARSLEAIAQFGRDRGPQCARKLGFTRQRTPCKATLHNVFKALDAGVFDAALADWLRGRRRAGWRALAVDGKTLRGATGEQLPGVHLLAAFAHEAHAAIAQISVDAKTNEHKAALRWLDMLDVEDAVITGDAAFCQRDLSRKIKRKKGIGSGR
jgi:hypothetical protein